MPPKASAAPAPATGTRPATVDFESRVDELTKLMRAFVELKSGFGEDHAKSRTLQNIFKQFDIDHTQYIDVKEFGKTLDYMNITCTDEEREALFDRFDYNRDKRLTFKEFSDAFFGMTRAPFGNPEARGIVKKVTDKLLSRGEGGLRGLTKCFALSDKDNTDAISKEELFNTLQRYGVQVTLADVDVVVKHFDRSGDGTISLTEFQRALRGFMSAERRALVETAYQILDANHDESVSLGELQRAYDTTKHPAVVKGEKTATQVLQEFSAGWNKNHDATVSLAEFVDYYEDISAMIENDTYFELMMRNAWHISGGTGAGQNTTCRRVLVTYKDGRQLIEEIKNDLGIGPKDIEKMKAALEQQGCRDILRVEIYGQ